MELLTTVSLSYAATWPLSSLLIAAPSIAVELLRVAVRLAAFRKRWDRNRIAHPLEFRVTQI
jgi:hypothetical protein